MRTALLFLLCMPWFAGAQDRYVTLALQPTADGSSRTNTLVVAEGEVVQVVSRPGARVQFPALPFGESMYLNVEKDGVIYGGAGVTAGQSAYDLSTSGLVLAGPAKLHMIGNAGILTFKITPSVFGPDKTLIVPPGPGGYVALESSTNLINWVTATNGLYQDPATARFFRIRLQSPK